MESDMKKQGYSQEEEYFFKKNQEMIEKMRKERESHRVEEEALAQKNIHWMKCPKCGLELEEVEHLGIKVDRCNNCSGIFFDKGEIDILLQSQEPKGFLMGFRKVFKI